MKESDIVNMFQGPNITAATVYQIIRECEDEIPCLNLQEPGRAHFTGGKAGRLRKSVKKRIGVSTQRLGKHHGVYTTRNYKRLSES